MPSDTNCETPYRLRDGVAECTGLGILYVTIGLGSAFAVFVTLACAVIGVLLALLGVVHFLQG